MSGPSRILLIIADSMLRQSVAEHLRLSPGLTVSETATAHEGLAAACGQHLIVVDEAVAEGDGGELCHRLREQGVTVPLLLLSAAVPEKSRCAVDGVVAKPLRLATLAAKITEMLARRPEPAGVRLGPWLFDAGRRQLVDGQGKVVRLTDKEVAILCRLGQAGGAVVGRDVLLTEVWGYSAAVTTHTLETHIYRLRRKIESGSGPAGLLRGESGGYRLCRP